VDGFDQMKLSQTDTVQADRTDCGAASRMQIFRRSSAFIGPIPGGKCSSRSGEIVVHDLAEILPAGMGSGKLARNHHRLSGRAGEIVAGIAVFH
jgi:hypothetical protein